MKRDLKLDDLKERSEVVPMKLLSVRVPVDLIKRIDRVVDLLNKMPERNRYLRGLRAWLGFRQTAVQFERPPRIAGEPKYTFWKSLALGINGIVAFSKVPLRFATYLGIVAAALSLVLTAWAVYQRLVGGDTVRGWASTVVVILLLGGIQLLMIGVVGEYLGSARGVGYLILQAEGTFDINTVMAGILVLTGFALLLDAAVGRIEKRLMKWQPRAAETERL